jgi:hypothetical protein
MGTGRSEAIVGDVVLALSRLITKLLLLLLSDFRNPAHVALGYRLSDRKVMCKATAQLCILLCLTAHLGAGFNGAALPRYPTSLEETSF